MLKCPNCGGKMVFHIPSQTMVCQSCGSKISPEQYDIDNHAETSSYETNVYLCPNCGAELTSPDEQAVSFCSYCGSQNIIPGKLEKQQAPQEIIPFRLSKKRCQNLYTKKASRTWFLPDELKKGQYLEQFRGIYIPYYAIDVSFMNPGTVDAYRMIPMGLSEYLREEYRISVSAENNKGRYMRDASSNLDDTISREISDYPTQAQKFHVGYLAGFYADCADVSPMKYKQDVEKEAEEDAVGMAESVVNRGIRIDRKSEHMTVTSHSRFGAQCRSFYTRLLPVWFLTWRKGNRVCYTVMNGVSGSMHCDFPVDHKKYLNTAAIISAVIFVLLMFLNTFTAPTMLGIVDVMGVIMTGVLAGELKRLQEQENHIHDIGSRQYRGAPPARPKTTRKIGIGCMVSLIYVVIFMGSALLAVSGSVGYYSTLRFLSFVCSIAGVIFMIRGVKNGSKVHEKGMALYPVLCTVPVLISLVLSYLQIPYDWLYYLVAMAILVASTVSAFALIRIYDLISTRPLPSFFSREGGNNRVDN